MVLALLLLLIPATASAAEWRPAHPDRLAVMDAAMAPMLSEYQPAFDAIVNDFTVMSSAFQFAGILAAPAAMQAKVDAAQRLPDDIAYAKRLASSALAVMDTTPPDACWADYGAVLRTGWLAYGDAADSLEVGAMDDANTYVGISLFLLGKYGDLVHGQSVTDCAA